MVLLRYFIIHSLFCMYATVLSAQERIDTRKNFREEYLHELLLEKLNSYRSENGLATLQAEKKLSRAARLQADWMLKKGRALPHPSSSFGANQRIKRYRAMHAYVNESLLSVGVHDKTKIAGQKGKVILSSYRELADAILQSWINDKKASKNLLDDNVYFFGIAFTFDEKKKSIYTSMLLASEKYDLPYTSIIPQHAYKLQTYSRSKCNAFLAANPNLPELMANNIIIEGKNIYFYFHDLAFFKNNFKKRKDALAADIVVREQYSCKTGNKLYPSDVHAGILLKPLRKSRLFASNKLKKSGEVLLKLGQMPQGLDSTNAEVNLLLIKEGCVCQSIFYNNMDGENISSLQIEAVMDTLSFQSASDSINNNLSFTIPFKRNQSMFTEEDVKPFLDSLELNRYFIKNISIHAYSSVEGDSAKNSALQHKRSQSILQIISLYNLDNVRTNIQTSENWEGFFLSLQGSPYEKQFAGLSKPQIRAKLLSDSLDFLLEPYLEDQRKAEVNLLVEMIRTDTLSPQNITQKFRQAIHDKNTDLARALQGSMYRYITEEKLPADSVWNITIPFSADYSILLSNHFVLKKMWADSVSAHEATLKNEGLALAALAPENPHIRYNKLIEDLRQWSENLHGVKEPEWLLREAKRLYTSRIENWKVNQLILNYHIIAADYYYERKEFSKREKELRDVRKYLQSAKLSRSQTYQIARYFIFQLRVDWAKELMLPFIKKQDYDEDFLFVFLTVAVYDTKKIPEEMYSNLMQEAATLNPTRFCRLIGFPNMSFQLLNNKKIKKTFCHYCNM